MGQAPLQFYDKVPLKFSEYGDNAFKQGCLLYTSRGV